MYRKSNIPKVTHSCFCMYIHTYICVYVYLCMTKVIDTKYNDLENRYENFVHKGGGS